tara:strand:+ start:358 stop:561 length:204 start_codon:yes stop_codon:yes gene_type:complete
MIKKIWNWIKNIFKPQRQEVDEHEELYLHVPEPDTPVYENEDAVKKEHCDRHLRFIKRCPDCIEVIK